MKEKQQRKQILNPASLDGNKLEKPKDIKHEIVEFYKDLIGTVVECLPIINDIIMQLGPIFSYEQQLDLQKDITDEKNIRKLKSYWFREISKCRWI